MDVSELAGSIRERITDHQPVLAVLVSPLGPPRLDSLAEELAGRLNAKTVRSARSPNSELSLYELRIDDRAVVLLIVKGDDERIVAIDKTTDEEISEIESDIYSSNISDTYVRLVSDIF